MLLENGADMAICKLHGRYNSTHYPGFTDYCPDCEAGEPMNEDIIEASQVHYTTAGNENDGYAGPGWYFWDETQAYRVGPFSSYGQTVEALGRHLKSLNGVNA